MFRGKGWFSSGMWKPKNPHSLEHLKYLYHVLYKNQVVNEQNKGLLVETLRSIAEILIWGDQNDSTVFDFFLEKNMLSFFLKIMKQKCGRYVCVQLLQTLNILFENIRNETSLYYLLSNNHVNSIIIHKFDFSDEEVMAYYISFLKTLSLKLNPHTIHFFYNEHTNDFPLYSEAIKFFKHSESMVRIAVRTLTLNVFKVDDKAMLKFIRDKTAAPYFSNLVWFIGEHVMELDRCVQSAYDLQAHNKLSDLVAEHLDHLHYLNDILCLKIDSLNDVLTDHLLYKLLIPLYVYSLVQRDVLTSFQEEKPHVSSIVSLFLLSQVFLIISHQPLVHQLANIIINGEFSIFSEDLNTLRAKLSASEFVNSETASAMLKESALVLLEENFEAISLHPSDECTPKSDLVVDEKEGSNITDEEKVVASRKLSQFDSSQLSFSLSNRPFLEAVFIALECTDNDHATLFALCVLYALGHNPGVNQTLLDTVLMPSEKSKIKLCYNAALVEKLIKIISQSCQYSSKVRIASLQMTILLLKQLVVKESVSYLQDWHLAALEQCREESTLMLRNFYKSEEIFLDMFEDEYEEMRKRPLNVEYLMMDPNLLLPPTATPMSGIEFHKRLPCGEVERARRAIRVFFLLRDLSLTLQNVSENQLPLTNISSCIKVNDALDLTNSDLICCTVIMKDGQKIKPFMVIDMLQLILVEPDSKRLGWGIAKFVGFLQDIEVAGDKDDSRCLHITVHRPSSIAAGKPAAPLLAARFVFDDHIRCMAAKQRLGKGRQKARQRKLHQIARLLELPDHIQPCPSPLRHGLHALRASEGALAMHRSQSQDTGLRGRSAKAPCQHRGPSGRVPGHAAALRRSPGRSEEIPLEDMSRNTPQRWSPGIRRRSSPGLPQARISAPPGIGHSHQQLGQSRSRTPDRKPDGQSKVAESELLSDPESLSSKLKHHLSNDVLPALLVPVGDVQLSTAQPAEPCSTVCSGGDAAPASEPPPTSQPKGAILTV